MLNIGKVNNINKSLFVFNSFVKDIASLNKVYGTNYLRLKDYDQIAYEVFQVFLIKLLLNMLVKFSSRDEIKRRDCFRSAKLLLAIGE